MTKEYAMKEEVYTKTITKVKLCKATNLSYPTIRCWMEKGLLTPNETKTTITIILTFWISWASTISFFQGV